ncbi:MAG: magnesium/cobalt transporter CorA [Lentisphaerae bacterium]|jgi:magnesium transporter|nr:magnesium/cobalt transporter CorA [Lentisphaerota bacterium]
MSKRKHHAIVPGLPPGALLRNDAAIVPDGVKVVRFDRDSYIENHFATAAEVIAFCQDGAANNGEQHPVTWINIAGLGDIQLIQDIGNALNLHPLTLEDAVSVPQRPKVDDYDSHLFITLKMLHPGQDGITVEQISLFLLKNTVVTMQEFNNEALEPVRIRLRYGSSKIRTMGADYLTYAIIDTVVDNYFPCLEQLAEQTEALEEHVFKTSTQTSTLEPIHRLRREISDVRRSVWPLRGMLNALCRDPLPLLGNHVRPFFRDCLDHTMQILENLDSNREAAAALMEVHLSMLSNRMGEVMKVLTIISTIFIPLTFLAGVYGMNFDYMPELRWRWGYLVCWAVMLACAAGMVWIFKKQGWLGRYGPPSQRPFPRLSPKQSLKIIENWLKQTKL